MATHSDIIETFNYEALEAACSEYIKANHETDYEADLVAQVAYGEAYESRAKDSEVTYDSFLSSMNEAATNIIVHRLFD